MLDTCPYFQKRSVLPKRTVDEYVRCADDMRAFERPSTRKATLASGIRGENVWMAVCQWKVSVRLIERIGGEAWLNKVWNKGCTRNAIRTLRKVKVNLHDSHFITKWLRRVNEFSFECIHQNMIGIKLSNILSRSNFDENSIWTWISFVFNIVFYRLENRMENKW